MHRKEQIPLDDKEDFIKNSVDHNTLIRRDDRPCYDIYGLCRFVEHRDTGRMIVEDLSDMKEEIVDYRNWEIYDRLESEKQQQEKKLKIKIVEQKTGKTVYSNDGFFIVVAEGYTMVEQC